MNEEEKYQETLKRYLISKTDKVITETVEKIHLEEREKREKRAKQEKQENPDKLLIPLYEQDIDWPVRFIEQFKKDVKRCQRIQNGQA